MEFKIEITPQAEADIEEAYRYIQAHAPEAAIRWVRRLREQIASLSLMPTRCPLAPEAGVLGVELRQLLFGRRSGTYRIIYRIVAGNQVVQVLAVRHGAREQMRPEDFHLD